MDAEPIKLFQEIKQRGFHSSIATTYSVDGAFYDGPVQRRLHYFDCVNNILVADLSMLSRSLSACPEAFAMAGRRYSIVPARVRGCFHPKLLLQLGERRARLFVGSANMTAPGWGWNLEIAACFDYRPTDLDRAPIGSIIRKGYDYLSHWLAPVGGETLEHKMRLHHRDSPWLGELKSRASPVTLADGTAVDLLCERVDGKPGILKRLVELVDGERVRRLIVVSPYWDEDLSALRNLRLALGMPATTVGLSPAVGEFPISAARKEWGLRFAAVPADEENRRFVHAKIFVVLTDKADHIVFGSANCSDAALGSMDRGGMNAEVSVYRRVGQDVALPMLDIDLSREFEPRAIAHMKQITFESGAGRTPSGQVEITGKVLKWWPPENVSGDGATLLAGGRSSPMARSGVHFLAMLDEIPALPLVVQFLLSNGKVTEPTLLHDTQQLFRASPGAIDRKTWRLFEDVREGRADLLDLAQRASELFAPPPGRPRGGGGDAERSSPLDRPAMEYATPADFRAALELLPGETVHPERRFATKDPTLLGLLRLVMSGIVDVPDPSQDARRERQREREKDKRLLEGEYEDGNDKTPWDPPKLANGANGERPLGPPPVQKPKEFYSAEEIERRRRYLKKAVAKFLRMLQALAKESGQVSDNLAVQASFIFSLMSLGVRMEHRMEDGSCRTLMAFEPTGKERKSCFVILAAQILRLIWVEQARTESIWARMSDCPPELPPPQDIRIFVVMSRWVMSRAYAAVALGRNKSLLAILGKLAVQVFAATVKFARVDQSEEEFLFRELDRSVGFMPTETDALLRRMKTLKKEVEGATVAPSTTRRSAAAGL